MNRFTRILGGLAALAAISCNANDTRTTVRYSILEDPGTTPADIKSWEAPLHSEIRDFDLLRMYEERDPDGAMRLCRSVAVDYLTHNTDIQNFRQVRREILETLAR